MKKTIMEGIGQTYCDKCGYTDPRALIFHHRNPLEKSFNISYGFTHSYAFRTLLAEAQKCDVLCENCHALEHYKGSDARAKRSAKNKQQIFKAIGQDCCKSCGLKEPISLTFHHRDPSEKQLKMANFLHYDNRLEQLIKEAKKCDILCRNCHFITHCKL